MAARGHSLTVLLLVGGEEHSTSGPCPWVCTLSLASTSPLRHLKLFKFGIYFLFLSAFYLVFVRLCKDIKEKQYLPWISVREKMTLLLLWCSVLILTNINDIITPWTIVSLIWRGWPLIYSKLICPQNKKNIIVLLKVHYLVWLVVSLENGLNFYQFYVHTCLCKANFHV